MKRHEMKPEDVETMLVYREAVVTAEAGLKEADHHRKCAKKRLDAAQETLNQFIDEIGEGPLPIELQAERNALAKSEKEAKEQAEAGEQAAENEPQAEEKTSSGDSEAWRSVPIEDLGTYGATGTDTRKLSEAGIKTLGDLSDHTAASEGLGLTSIKGIGEKTSERILNAISSYYADHPWKESDVKDDQIEDKQEDETPKEDGCETTAETETTDGQVEGQDDSGEPIESSDVANEEEDEGGDDPYYPEDDDDEEDDDDYEDDDDEDDDDEDGVF